MRKSLLVRANKGVQATFLLGEYNESRSLPYKWTVQSTLTRNFSLCCFYGKQNVNLRVLFVRIELANQQKKCKYQFIMIYTGVFELCGDCLLSLNIKILYTDINKGESNTNYDILSVWYTSVIVDNNTYRKCWKEERCLKKFPTKWKGENVI